MKKVFEVTKSLLHCSFQGERRIGFRKFGIPPSGPMDMLAYEKACILAGVRIGEPLIEIIGGNFSLNILEDCEIAVTGADLNHQLDGEKFPLWKTIRVYKGQTITFGNPVNGMIAYLALVGGYQTNWYLGSPSTYTKGKLGKILTKGTMIEQKSSMNTDYKLWYAKTLVNSQRSLCPSVIPTYMPEIEVRYWPSYHSLNFSEEQLQTFQNQQYTFKTGNRTGYLFDGNPIYLEEGHDIPSEATEFGTIQLPPNGKPIILMSDAQTIGGYVTLGKIDPADLWKIAQLKPGGKVSFHEQQI